MTAEEKTLAFAEARFFCAPFSFRCKKIMEQCSLYRRTVTDFKVSNTIDIWPNIEADFQFALIIFPKHNL